MDFTWRTLQQTKFPSSSPRSPAIKWIQSWINNHYHRLSYSIRLLESIWYFHLLWSILALRNQPSSRLQRCLINWELIPSFQQVAHQSKALWGLFRFIGDRLNLSRKQWSNFNSSKLSCSVIKTEYWTWFFFLIIDHDWFMLTAATLSDCVMAGQDKC